MEQRKLEAIEQYVFSLFHSRSETRMLTREIFESTNEFANADLVRAFEDLEKRWRLIVRYTHDGHDWIALTPEGAKYADVTLVDDLHSSGIRHPPRSSTDPPNSI
jgi:hypothetical protein